MFGSLVRTDTQDWTKRRSRIRPIAKLVNTNKIGTAALHHVLSVWSSHSVLCRVEGTRAR